MISNCSSLRTSPPAVRLPDPESTDGSPGCGSARALDESRSVSAHDHRDLHAEFVYPEFGRFVDVINLDTATHTYSRILLQAVGVGRARQRTSRSVTSFD